MDQVIKTIIVDDEQEAREGIRLLLDEETGIELVAMCKNGVEAIEILSDFKIDLMFLDIQMPMVDGFEVVRSVHHDRLPAIIFTTAYDQYAVKAFEIHAIDYLLKPFSDQRFGEALERARDMIRQKKQEAHTEILRGLATNAKKGNLENIVIDPESSNKLDKLVVKDSGKVHFLDLKAVVWIEAFDYYVKIHIADHFYTVRESMKKLEQRLPADKFIRIHKSTIINLAFIKTVERMENGDYQVILTTSSNHKVSRTYKDSVKELMK